MLERTQTLVLDLPWDLSFDMYKPCYLGQIIYSLGVSISWWKKIRLRFVDAYDAQGAVICNLHRGSHSVPTKSVEACE